MLFCDEKRRRSRKTNLKSTAKEIRLHCHQNTSPPRAHEVPGETVYSEITYLSLRENLKKLFFVGLMLLTD